MLRNVCCICACLLRGQLWLVGVSKGHHASPGGNSVGHLQFPRGRNGLPSSHGRSNIMTLFHCMRRLIFLKCSRANHIVIVHNVSLEVMTHGSFYRLLLPKMAAELIDFYAEVEVTTKANYYTLTKAPTPLWEPITLPRYSPRNRGKRHVLPRYLSEA